MLLYYALQKKQGRSRTAQRFQRFQESDYMDPEQGLCLGALFDIAATNVSKPFCCYWTCPFLTTWFDECGNFLFQGLDMGRRLCIIGFCRSIEMLSDVVEDTVLEHGGEVRPFKSILCSIWLLQLKIWCFYLIIVWSVASTKAGLRLHQTYHCRPYYFLWSLL